MKIEAVLALLIALQGCASSATGVTSAPPSVPSVPSAPSIAEGRAAEPAVLAELADATRVVRISEVLTVQRAAREAYVLTHDAGIVPANILVVRMPDGTLVLCSSPYETETTRAMLRWLRETFSPPRIVAINTHFHPDGAAGNEAYAEEGVETYASEMTQKLIEARGAEVLGMTARAVGEPLRAPMERTQIALAKHTFDAREGLSLTFGGESLEAIYPGPAHSPDNVVVHFPSRKLLFGGCMVRAAAASIGYKGDADIENWEAAARSLVSLAPEVVVPGHGAIGGADLLEHTIDVAHAARTKK
ncbi:MAG TPA: MBL fold metallo-hydrolase [Candidatus Nanopelagicales bacterium]|nr:MBL fold metallo-hydrolase [Candidatus Nanopelagicales bacterium]